MPVETIVTNGTQIIKSFNKQAVMIIPKVAMGIIVFLAFYLASKGANILIKKYLKRLKRHQDVAQLLTRVSNASILAFGTITALGTAGVNVTGLAAGLGLIGFGASFAFKDYLSNVLAGFMILFYRPFRIGDCINGTNFDGVVEDINLRYIVLRSDHTTSLVPNATMLSNVINIKKESA